MTKLSRTYIAREVTLKTVWFKGEGNKEIGHNKLRRAPKYFVTLRLKHQPEVF